MWLAPCPHKYPIDSSFSSCRLIPASLIALYTCTRSADPGDILFTGGQAHENGKEGGRGRKDRKRNAKKEGYEERRKRPRRKNRGGEGERQRKKTKQDRRERDSERRKKKVKNRPLSVSCRCMEGDDMVNLPSTDVMSSSNATPA